MSPELIDAVKERINLGHSKEEISAELHTAGYDESSIDAAYNQASGTISDIPSPTPVAGNGLVQLPSASKLFGSAWGFAQTRLDLILYLAAPLVLISIIQFFVEGVAFEDQMILVTTGSIFGLISLVVYALTFAAVLYTVVNLNERQVPYGEAFSWAQKNFWGLVWIYILVMAVVWGGFLLLIIPGIIVSLYVYFTKFVFAKEGLRGMDALLRSRDLVKGNWSVVFGRLLVVSLIFFVVFLGLGILVGLASSLTGEIALATLGVNIGFQFLSAGAALMSLYIGMELYGHLAAARPLDMNASKNPVRWKYIALAWLGPAGMIFLVVISFGAVYSLDGIEGARSQANSAIVQQQLNTARVEAELYYNREDFSYRGVCNDLEEMVVSADEVVCNDGADHYAITAELAGESWCADSTGFMKKIFASLEDRTVCLEVPVIESVPSLPE